MNQGMKRGREPQRRAFWLKTLHQWHWISSALCLIGMLLFSVTGITLNHASQIEASPVVESRKATLPEALREQLTAQPATAVTTLPPSLREWLATELSLRIGERTAEWSEDEIYLALPRPGGDAWLSIERESGELQYELTRRGWISYLNDLHKGRNAGAAWGWFIDVFAVATLIFCITGLFLLQLHAGQRATTWPVVGLGLVIPVLLALLFIH
jgi:hypothetical protein